jgi:hypothetical protein
MSRILELYRRAPDWSAFMLAATVSSVLAVVTGIAGGFAGVYLYDRGRSKGDDFAVLIIGVLAVGAFAFVVLLTWLRTLHHKISSRTPFSAWLFCVICDLAVTVWLWPRYDPLTEDHYLPFIYAGWTAIILLGLLALFICARWVVHEPH